MLVIDNIRDLLFELLNHVAADGDFEAAGFLWGDKLGLLEGRLQGVDLERKQSGLNERVGRVSHLETL